MSKSSYDGTVNFVRNEPQNPYARISEIASKLGVLPYRQSDAPTILMPGADEQMYDVFEITSRFLDRLDTAIKEAEGE